MRPSTQRLISRINRILTVFAVIFAVFFGIGFMQQRDAAAQAKAESQMRERIARKQWPQDYVASIQTSAGID